MLRLTATSNREPFAPTNSPTWRTTSGKVECASEPAAVVTRCVECAWSAHQRAGGTVSAGVAHGALDGDLEDIEELEQR